MELLPAVEDGRVALVAQLQAGGGDFSRQGFEIDAGVDSHLPLKNNPKIDLVPYVGPAPGDLVLLGVLLLSVHLEPQERSWSRARTW